MTMPCPIQPFRSLFRSLRRHRDRPERTERPAPEPRRRSPMAVDLDRAISHGRSALAGLPPIEPPVWRRKGNADE